MSTLSRKVPIDPTHAALLIIDVQNYCAHPNGAAWRGHAPAAYFFRTLHEVVIPNLQRLQSARRRARIEVVYSAVENMTRDGRDRSLDYKISGIDVPRGSWDARVLDEIAPAEDEMIFRKTSGNVFISTNIDYVLRNLDVRSLIIAGIMTDECVESAVRDACDLGCLVTVVIDVCTTTSAEHHEQSLLGIRGYCRQRTSDFLVAEISALNSSNQSDGWHHSSGNPARRRSAYHVRRDKAARFQRVQAPPGDRSSRKRPEQAWR